MDYRRTSKIPSNARDTVCDCFLDRSVLEFITDKKVTTSHFRSYLAADCDQIRRDLPAGTQRPAASERKQI